MKTNVREIKGYILVDKNEQAPTILWSDPGRSYDVYHIYQNFNDALRHASYGDKIVWVKVDVIHTFKDGEVPAEVEK